MLTKWDVKVQLLSFASGSSVSLLQLVERTILSLLDGLGTLLKNQLTVDGGLQL
jgi:hypothetical protein